MPLAGRASKFRPIQCPKMEGQKTGTEKQRSEALGNHGRSVAGQSVFEKRIIIEQWARENGLTVHPTKTRIVDASQRGGFDFLGYHFERSLKWPREKSMVKFKEGIRQQTSVRQSR